VTQLHVLICFRRVCPHAVSAVVDFIAFAANLLVIYCIRKPIIGFMTGHQCLVHNPRAIFVTVWSDLYILNQ